MPTTVFSTIDPGLAAQVNTSLLRMETDNSPTVVTIEVPNDDGTADGRLGDIRYRVIDDEPRIYTLAISKNSKPQWRELLSRKTDSSTGSSDTSDVYEHSTADMTVLDGSIFNLEQSDTGDAAMQFELTGGKVYSLGIDNSASDIFQLYDVTAGQKLWHYDSDGLDIASGDAYHINNTSVLTATTLGGAVVNSSLTSLGTIATGVWEGTDVGLAHGGTGASLSDPGADRIFFWDDGGTTTGFLAPGDGVEISGTNLLVDLNTTNLKFTSNEIDTIQSIATGASVQFEHLGLGGARTEGYLHINPGAAGSVTAHTNYDDLVIEGSVTAGISILSPVVSGISFGSAADSFAAAIFWNTSSSRFGMMTSSDVDAKLEFWVGNGSLLALTLAGDQNATFNGDLRVDGGDIGISGDTNLMQLSANQVDINGNLGLGGARTEGFLHINPGGAGDVTASTLYDDLVVEHTGGKVGITILSSPSNYGGLLFGTSVDNFSAGIFWSESFGHLLISTNTGANLDAELIFKVSNNVIALTLAGDTNATFVGDLRVDGGDIGISADTDLMQLAVNSLTVNGDIILSDNSLTGVDTIAFTDTAGTIAGIQNQNLLDKTATENVTGTWQIARLGINGAITDGDFHVNPGAAGSVTPSSAWDTVVVVDSSHSAISILGPPTAYQGIVFGESTDSFAAALLWISSYRTLSINCYNTAAAKMQFRVAQGYVALTLGSDRHATFDRDIRVDGGDIGISADTNLIQLATNNVTINGNLDIGTPGAWGADLLSITAMWGANMSIENTGNSTVYLRLDSDRPYANVSLARISGYWNNTEVASVAFYSGTDTTNKDDGEIHFGTSDGGGVGSAHVILDNSGGLHFQRDSTAQDPTVKAQHAAIYSKDVGGVAEMFVQDEATNITQISPHDPDGFYLINTYSKKRDVTLRFHLEKWLLHKYEQGEIDDEFLDIVQGKAI